MRPTSKPYRALVITLVLTLFAVPCVQAGDGSDRTPGWVGSFDLDEFDHLAGAFNQHRGSVRLVALLSASCAYCVKGYRYMRKLLQEIPDPRLKMLIVWEPMLSGDTRALSLKMARMAEDRRIVYQSWDPGRVTGDTYTALLQAEDDRWTAGDSTAWDVYFLYEGDVVWENGRPTAPTYWQHQGAGSRELSLNYTNLKNEIEKRLDQLPPPSGATRSRR